MVRSFAWFVDKIFLIIYFALILRIVISWVGSNSYNEFVQTIYKITDPILKPFRRLPLQVGAIDFSPMVAFLLLSMVRGFVVNILYKIADKLG
ncbi:MAG: YggT family protein [Candidatus Omnitrophota bacterium]